jgi:tRNA nucleotidyltransferase/poly(A) polymerase
MKIRLKSAKARDRAATIQHILQILHKWGIHTLGEFAALDKEQIGLRLGPEAIHLWERAQGKTTRLLKLIQPPESFEETFEFENEIETAEPLLFMLRRFLQQLSLRLDALYLVAKELTLRLTFTNKSSYERCFKIPEPTNDIEVLFRMLHTHLETLRTDSAVRRYVRDAGPLLDRLNQLTRADVTTGNRFRAKQFRALQDDLEERIARLAEEENLESLRPPLDGLQVMEHLGLAPGPVVGEALAYLMELRIERGPIEEAEAVELLDAWAAERGIATNS